MVDSLRKNKGHNLKSQKKFKDKYNNISKEKNKVKINQETLFIVNKISKKQIFKRWLKRFFLFCFILFFSMLMLAGFLLFRFSQTSKKVIIVKNKQKFSQSENVFATAKLAFNLLQIKNKNFQNIDLKGKEREQINILLLGIAGKGKAGTNLTDTIMLMSLNLKKKKIALLSLPRDLYYLNHNSQEEEFSGAKINSLYQRGINQHKGAQYIVKAVENVTGLPVDYYFILDFDGFKKIIDDIGGIDIYSERDYYDTRYPGPNYSYETFQLKKGWHHLNGEIALKYARERHSDPEGDFGRAKRQQQVIQAVRDKIFSQNWLNIFKMNKLLGNIENNLKTNVDLDDIDDFVFLAYNLDTKNIINKAVDAWKQDSLLRVDHLNMNGIRAFILVPKKGYADYSDIHQLTKNLFQ